MALITQEMEAERRRKYDAAEDAKIQYFKPYPFGYVNHVDVTDTTPQAAIDAICSDPYMPASDGSANRYSVEVNVSKLTDLSRLPKTISAILYTDAKTVNMPNVESINTLKAPDATQMSFPNLVGALYINAEKMTEKAFYASAPKLETIYRGSFFEPPEPPTLRQKMAYRIGKALHLTATAG